MNSSEKDQKEQGNAAQPSHFQSEGSLKTPAVSAAPSPSTRCPQCLTERPANEMRERRITQIRRGAVVTDAMLFCADKPCGEHYQMGCEG